MANTTAIACKFLESLQRFDLAMLLKHCQMTLAESEVDNGFFTDLVDEAIVDAPMPIGEALNKLPPQDRKRIAEAIASAYPNKKAPDDIVIRATDATIGGAASLLAELLIHRDMMIDVATGGARIQEVDDYYRAREIRIRQTIPEGVRYENPHDDLWDWYRHWSADLPQYKDRRFMFVSYLVLQSMPFRGGRRCHPSHANQLAGSALIAPCPRHACNLKPHQPKRTVKLSACYAARS